jgi:hypothetical protein
MQFSYVITYRSDQEIRAANVFAVLRWLSEMRDIEIVLVEQDRRPRLTIDRLLQTARITSFTMRVRSTRRGD